MRYCIVVVLLAGLALTVRGQSSRLRSCLEPADTFDRLRFGLFAGGAAATFGGILWGLESYWYSQYERGPFHLYNDAAEWEQMDKMGHIFNGYYQSRFGYNGFRWAGLRPSRAVWGGVVMGSVFQGTFEVLDGFSKKWGFSIPDIIANEVGCAAFAAQEWAWREQRITIKVSCTPPDYPADVLVSTDGLQQSSLRRRGGDLFGRSFFSSFFKDYNGQTYWASANIASFFRQKPAWLPAWLNLAAGYGAGNLYGGYRNEWEQEGSRFVPDAGRYPRYRQYFLSFDIDLTRLPVRNRVLKTFLSVFHFIKIPSPTLEFNSLGQVRLHPLFF